MYDDADYDPKKDEGIASEAPTIMASRTYKGVKRFVNFE